MKVLTPQKGEPPAFPHVSSLESGCGSKFKRAASNRHEVFVRLTASTARSSSRKIRMGTLPKKGKRALLGCLDCIPTLAHFHLAKHMSRNNEAKLVPLDLVKTTAP